MEKLIAKPQLGFGEAVKLAMSRLTQMSGRSRRSEFWWAALVLFVGIYVVNSILSAVLPLMAAQIVGSLLTLIALPLTARRLQDTGKSHWWVIVSWVASLIYSVRMVQSGVIDELLSVNADPEALLGVFQDPLLIGASIVQFVAGLATFIFCLLDSSPQANKYGESPKYVALSEE